MFDARLCGSAALVALTYAAAPATAQIRSDAAAAAVEFGLATEAVPVVFVQPPDVGAYLAEDEVRGPFPLRYGALLEADVATDRDGVWDPLPNGDWAWRFKVLSPGAKSIGLEFDDFWLPEGGRVSLYDDTLETVFGAYGAVNNQPNGELQLEPFPGDSVIFEYVHPAGATEFARLHLGTVIYDYRGLFELEQGLLPESEGGSGDGGCLVDVNCPDGDPFALEKRATVRTLSNGSLCSGALINNTAFDGEQLVLTAWHCGQGSNTVFRFNYQKSGCDSGGAPTGQNVSGATNLASYQTADGRLLRINSNIPSSYNPYFAGWSRSTANLTFAMSMHHPAGGVKRISIDHNGAFKTNANFQGIGSVQAWRCDWQIGDTLGGSSGGPLFDQDGRLRGVLTGGPGGTCPQIDYYGRLHNFWGATAIATWLDPLGLGLTAIDGYDPNNPGGGAGGTDPQIDSISPASIAAVNADSPVSVTLTGDGFEGLTAVEVDGVPLAAFPPQFTVTSNSTLVVTILPPYDLGTKTIKVIEGAQSAEVSLPVTANLTPTIDLVNSDPGFLLSALPIEVYMGSKPNDTVFLLASTTLAPSSLPGLFDAAIGAGLTDLYLIDSFVVSPTTGHAKVAIPFGGIPIGTRLYFQAGVLDSVLPTLPLTMTNVESGTVLF